MLGQVSRLLSEIGRVLRPAAGRAPILTREGLIDFLRSRSAYIAQTALYGYLKTRMGTQYRAYFQDESFAPAIAAARDRAFLDCLADLTIFAVAMIGAGRPVAQDALALTAIRLFDGVASGSEQAIEAECLNAARTAFRDRVRATDWQAAVGGAVAFTQSPRGLVEAAPVSDDFRAADREIVENSVRFRWLEVRRAFRRDADRQALAHALWPKDGVIGPE